MKQNINAYYNKEAVSKSVAAGNHRNLIGGLWDELGELQLEYLRSNGLRPDQALLDIGCGCLRAGTRFVDYLDADNYFGIDLSEDLIEAGYNKELSSELRSKLPRSNLAITDRFEVEQFGVEFDIAIAQSVFTHLPLNFLKLCLAKIQSSMKAGAPFYISFFEAQNVETWINSITHQPGGVVTFPESDPYHYLTSQLEDCTSGLLFEFECVGSWEHPRNQKLAKFTKLEPTTRIFSETRSMNWDQAMTLVPGSEHYRAYVGPPGRFDFMSATQFSLLFALGLEETSNVLDIGCGSLRLGRLLIPFLLPNRYCGVEPNTWLVDDGFERELGNDSRSLKRPAFSSSADYNFAEFEKKFDFVMAQSIITHTGPDQLRLILQGTADHLHENGLFLFSYIEGKSGAPLPEDGWHYPYCISYNSDHLKRTLAEFGLSATEIPWFHPGASWMIATKDPTKLPQGKELEALQGRVVGSA